MPARGDPWGAVMHPVPLCRFAAGGIPAGLLTGLSPILNPIETGWAALRKELAIREQKDLAEGNVISTAQFRQRVAQILKAWSVPAQGEQFNYFQKLLRGMPRRLARCKANKYGHCGK